MAKLNTIPVSAIIPCWNSIITLNRAVKSVIGQTLKPLQIILVDDGSTDGTLVLMYQLQKKYGDDWIDIIEFSHNMGVSIARNSGWESAKGEYIAFLDSDDTWHPQKLEIQYNYMKHYPHIEITGHGYNKILSQDRHLIQNYVYASDYKVKVFSFKYVLLKNPIITPSFMVKKNIDFRFLEGSKGFEDHLFLIEISDHFGPIHAIQLPLANIYKHEYGETGLSSKMWTMQKGHVLNYKYLYNKKKITLLANTFLIMISLIRYLKRLFVVHFFLAKN